MPRLPVRVQQLGPGQFVPNAATGGVLHCEVGAPGFLQSDEAGACEVSYARRRSSFVCRPIRASPHQRCCPSCKCRELKRGFLFEHEYKSSGDEIPQWHFLANDCNGLISDTQSHRPTVGCITTRNVESPVCFHTIIDRDTNYSRGVGEPEKVTIR